MNPEVSKTKFEREIAEYRSRESLHRSRGWFLVRADWPHAVVMFLTNHTVPPTLVGTVRFDYTNYDAEPPSVRFIEPLTERELLTKEVIMKLPRMMPDNQIQDLVQSYGPDEVPFLCIPGVKEYHEHPGHSGDPWVLHRRDGEGRLVHLLTAISKYGLDNIGGLNVNISFGYMEIPA